MSSAEPPRARIADIIRESGKMGNAATGVTPDQIAAFAATIGGASAGAFLASESLADELAKRFSRLATNAALERELDAPYETAGRALILALQACNHVLNAAFDTASGAILETKKPMSLLAPAFTVTIAITDNGATTHLNAQAQHTGMNWGQNQKVLNELFTKTDDYLTLFKS